MSDAELEKTLKEMSDAEAIEVFVGSLLVEKGISDEDEAAMAMMKKDLAERVSDFLTQALIDALPADGVTELDGMISLGVVTPENIQGLLKRFKVDTEKVLAGALEEFRKEYLGEE